MTSAERTAHGRVVRWSVIQSQIEWVVTLRRCVHHKLLTCLLVRVQCSAQQVHLVIAQFDRSAQLQKKQDAARSGSEDDQEGETETPAQLLSSVEVALRSPNNHRQNHEERCKRLCLHQPRFTCIYMYSNHTCNRL